LATAFTEARDRTGEQETLAELADLLAKQGQRPTIQWSGDFIVQGATKDGAQLFQEVQEEMERFNLATTGTPEER